MFASGVPFLLMDCLGCLGVQCRECLSSTVSFKFILGRLPWQHMTIGTDMTNSQLSYQR